jgi:hypothetical protein
MTPKYSAWLTGLAYGEEGRVKSGMGFLWKLFEDNWAIIMIAPGLFAGALFLGWLAGWVVIRLVYNQRLAHQGDMITNLRAVLEEKLPASFLPPPPRKRSKRMSFGLILIFVGAGAALIGALLVAFDKTSQPPKTIAVTPVAPSAIPPIVQNPLPTPPAPEAKEFTDRTPGELLAMFEDRTMFQANQLIEPLKGKWMKADGNILQIIPNGPPGASTVVLRGAGRLISCNIGSEWSARVAKLNTDDSIKVEGKIQPFQNGQQLYLLDCVLVD